MRSWLSESSSSYGVMFAARCGTRSRSISMPVPARLAISNDEQVRPAAPMSWMPTITPRPHRLEARLDQTLLGEGIADLHGRPLRVGALVELGGGEQAGAVDAVAAGLRAGVDHRVAEPRGLPEEDAVGLDEAEVEGVDQDVAAVALVEGGLAADRRDADRVAVAADPVHHAAQQHAVLRVLERAEAERVHRRDRPRAHA